MLTGEQSSEGVILDPPRKRDVALHKLNQSCVAITTCTIAVLVILFANDQKERHVYKEDVVSESPLAIAFTDTTRPVQRL